MRPAPELRIALAKAEPRDAVGWSNRYPAIRTTASLTIGGSGVTAYSSPRCRCNRGRGVRQEPRDLGRFLCRVAYADRAGKLGNW